MLIFGGGSPKNFRSKPSPRFKRCEDRREGARLLPASDRRAARHRRFVGSDSSEAVSWGKIDPDRFRRGRLLSGFDDRAAHYRFVRARASQTKKAQAAIRSSRGDDERLTEEHALAVNNEPAPAGDAHTLDRIR